MFVSTLTHSRTVEATFTFLGNKKSSVLTFIWPHNDSCLYNISRLGRPTWKRDIMGITPTQWLCLKFPLLRCKHDIVVSLCVRHEINYAVTFRIQQELLNKTKTSRNRCTRIVRIQAATDANTSQQTRKYTRKVVATYRCEHRREAIICHVIVRFWFCFYMCKLSLCLPGPPAPSLQRCPWLQI